MGRDEWVAEAEARLKPYLEDSALEYAESLYVTYVEEDSDDWSPEDAVNEDLTYWD